MKLALVFVVNFNFVPNEKNVLEYILAQYAEYYQEKPGKKAKAKPAENRTNLQKLNSKIQGIFAILQDNKVPFNATVSEINPSLDKHIADILEINAELNEIFIFDETLQQKKAVIFYTLFGQKYQIVIQYSGHVTKLYFNNVMKCIKCYIQDGKAWSLFVMKHDFGDINETKVLGVLEVDQNFSVEYNDNLDDKKIRDNDIKYDGYVWPTNNEVSTLFTTEIEQVSIFKERPPTGKSKKEGGKQLVVNEDSKKLVNIWDFPPNSNLLSGILDSEQKWKAINVVQSWHKEFKHIPKEVQKQKVEIEIPENESTHTKGKSKKPKKKTLERMEEEKVKVDVKVNGTNLFSDSPSSALFHDSTPQGHYFGILLKAKDPLPPELTEGLKPLNLMLGNLKNLPIDLLSEYGVKRIHACIDFEQPLTNIKTIPQSISKDICFNFFKMTPFMNIKNYQQFFAAFYLKQMTIQLIGEIEKDIEEETLVAEEVVGEVGPLKEQDRETTKKQGKKNKNKKRSLVEVVEENTEEETENLLEIETVEQTKPKQGQLIKDLFESQDLVSQLDDDEKRELEKLKIPSNIILSENNQVILIRICIFRLNLTSLVKCNNFNRIQEILTPSAIFDNEPPIRVPQRKEKEIVESSLEVNLPQSKMLKENSMSLTDENNSRNKNTPKRRGYLIGVDFEHTLTLEFDFYIHAPFRSLCKEYYKPDDTGLNNILILSRDKSPVTKLVRHIQKYNSRIPTSNADSSATVRPNNPVTGFSLQFSDVAIIFTEAIIKSPFPLLLKWVLKFRDSFEKIIYNTELIIPERIYPEFLDLSGGLFTYQSNQHFRDALRKEKSAEEVLVDLCELIHVRSIEDIHKYQLLPDAGQLNSLHESTLLMTVL